MKTLFVIVTVLGIALAQREPAKEVINTFRTIAPQYLTLLKNGEVQLAKIRDEATNVVAKFHDDIILIKETYVLDAIKKEHAVLTQIVGQNVTVDSTCLRFLNTSLDMNINIAGVGFTNCINSVDDAFNTLATNYYKSLGVHEALIAELRLLDVFRGENVFYTPQNIIDKLNKKLAELKVNPEGMATEFEQAKQALVRDLEAIRSTYVGCMTAGEQLLKSAVDITMQQLTLMCQGTLI